MSRIIGFTVEYGASQDTPSSFDAPMFCVELPDQVIVLEVYPTGPPGQHRLLVVCLDERGDELTGDTDESADSGEQIGGAGGPQMTRFAPRVLSSKPTRLPWHPHDGPRGA